MRAPIAKKIKKELEKHGDIRIDNYYWLNERDNPEVISYLEQEKKYTESVFENTQVFQTKLFDEMRSRIKEDDSSVPYKFNGYWYLTQYLKGKEYPTYKRRNNSLNSEDEILFDVNEMAKNYAYYHLSGISVSPDNSLCSFGIDSVSRRIYTIQFKDLKTGEILTDKIENTTGGSVWANDNKTIFYTRKDDTLRACQIWKHKLGSSTLDDTLVFEENDDTYSVYVYKSKSRDYIIIGSSSTVSDEYRFISSNTPDAEFKLFQKRERDLEYSIEHFGKEFYIQTNKDGAYNFKLMKTPISKTEQNNWVEVISHRKDVFIEGFEIFKNYLVIEERANGLIQMNIKSWDKNQDYYLPFIEETYTAGSSVNLDFDTDILRYSYSSLTTPTSIIDFDMKNKILEIKKEQIVLGEFNKKNYKSKRIWAEARDGKSIAISLVYHKDTNLTQNTPLLLYAYGSYGYTIEANFSSVRLTLLNRGFVFAIAHVRGGQYLGREWYEDGKMLKKKNTFFDYIDVAKYLIKNEYTSSAHLYGMGGSAGGLLMGAVINYEPKLFNGIIAQVPFVDVVTTMLDDSIPLTTGEYDEWGNPNNDEYYFYMKEYSPYDNVEKKSYPNIYVSTGLNDSQVQYWEPAKWVAKLRDLKTDNNILILDINMDTGHGGASGRFESLKEDAREDVFLFMLEGITK